MKTLLLLLFAITSVNAYEAEFLHQAARNKVIAPRTGLHMTGTLWGMRLSFRAKDIGVVKFDEKRSFALRPSGIKTPLTFKKWDKPQLGHMWSCKFTDDIAHMNMEEGVFVYHLFFTVDSKDYSVVHKVKYTTRGKKGERLYPRTWSQKESV